MIVSDILDFIRFVKEHKKDETDYNRNIFDDFIEPLWNKFKEVHQDYKNTFKEYSKMIIAQENLESIMEEVNKDSVYSADLRIELESMVTNIPLAFPESSKELMEKFLISITCYFEAKSYFKIESNSKIYLLAPTYSNAARYRVSLALYNNSNKKEIEEVLNTTISILQSNFKWVSDNYYKLKNSFRT